MNFLENHKRLIIITLSALVFALFTFSFAEIAEVKIKARAANAQNQITFSGVAEISSVPDVANVTVKVYETAKEAVDAEGRATLKANQVLNLLQENAVNKKDITTSQYRVSPKYVYLRQPFYKRVADGFEAVQTISVKLRDLSKVGDIMSNLVKLEVSEVNGPFFAIDDVAKLNSELQLKAINDAKMKAEMTAKNLGIKLGKIIRFYEEPANHAPQTRMMMARGLEAESFDAASPQSPQIEAGSQKISARVSITYEIE